LPKASEWFEKNMLGRVINLPVFLRKVSTYYLGKGKYSIEASFRFREPSFSFNGYQIRFIPSFKSVHTAKMRFYGQDVEIRYVGDESTARKWSRVPKATPIVVQGTIMLASIIPEPFLRRGAVCKLRLADVKAPVKEKPGVKERVEEDSNKEDPNRLLSVLAILNRIPRHLLPDPNKGWDKATLLRANDWLRKYVKRKPFRGQLEFAKCDVSHIKGSVYKVIATWKMLPDIGFAFKKQAVLLKLTVYTDLSDSMGSSLTDLSHSVKQTYTVNHANAKKWESMSKGGRVDIGGHIAFVGLSGNRDSGYICTAKVQMTKMSEQRARYALTRKPKKSKRPQVKTKPAADQAASRVRLAKAYLSSGLKAKAVSILKEVIEKYPNTKAADEAKELLKGAGE